MDPRYTLRLATTSDLAYLSGDPEACIQAAKAMNPGKTLSAGIPQNDSVLGKYFNEFEKRYDLIVSEKRL